MDYLDRGNGNINQEMMKYIVEQCLEGHLNVLYEIRNLVRGHVPMEASQGLVAAAMPASDAAASVPSQRFDSAKIANPQAKLSRKKSSRKAMITDQQLDTRIAARPAALSSMSQSS